VGEAGESAARRALCRALQQSQALEPLQTGLLLATSETHLRTGPAMAHAMRNEIACWLDTRLLEPKRSGRVYTLVEVFSPERRGSERSRTYVAQKSDLIILPMFVLSQIERPGRALAGRTAGRLHLQHLRGLLSTSHAKRAREAASSPSLLNVSSSCFPTPQSDQVG